MATVQYPPFLPLPQRADQNMTQDTAWQTTQTAVGPLIITPITTDLKANLDAAVDIHACPGRAV